MKKETAVEWLFAHLLPFLEFSDPKEREHFRKCLTEARQPPYCIALVSGCPSSQIKIK